ncbi:MAG: hypothetical protein WC676_05710 [Candidatus Omnitrophota bacterium]
MDAKPIRYSILEIVAIFAAGILLCVAIPKGFLNDKPFLLWASLTLSLYLLLKILHRKNKNILKMQPGFKIVANILLIVWALCGAMFFFLTVFCNF